MGQYYLVVNLDKREYLHPHKFDDGMKLREFGASREGTMTALSVLLASGNGRGGGDSGVTKLAGRWAGDRIVIAGDYADEGEFIDANEGAIVDDGITMPVISFNLHSLARQRFTDISLEVIQAFRDVGEDIRVGFYNE